MPCCKSLQSQVVDVFDKWRYAMLFSELKISSPIWIIFVLFKLVLQDNISKLRQREQHCLIYKVSITSKLSYKPGKSVTDLCDSNCLNISMFINVATSTLQKAYRNVEVRIEVRKSMY